MRTFYITQTLTPAGWRSCRSTTNPRDAKWNAADMCNREEYGASACKPDQVRTVEVQAQDVGAAFSIANAPFRAELTATGEQYVIPGAERDAEQGGARQMELF